MAKKETTHVEPSKEAKVIRLGALLSTTAVLGKFSIWIVGDTPLITHAWSEKARREMLEKQVKATKAGKEERKPQEDFVSSLYDMGDETYGFPVTGIKNCILSAAHKDKGVPRSTVMSALYLDAEMVRTRPALAGAVCDMPLVRIYGSAPEMREDMVKIGTGLNRKANLSYRAQFTHWAIRVTGSINQTVLTTDALTYLIVESGKSSGLGEWRNERRGIFGSFHLANHAEELAWDRHADDGGPLPMPAGLKLAAE